MAENTSDGTPRFTPSFGPSRITKASVSQHTSGGIFQELGRTGLRHWGGYILEEWERTLQGKRGADVYREMSDNDAVVGGILYAIEMLVRKTSWWWEPAGDTQPDLQANEYCESLLDDMSYSWPDTVSEILSFLPFGWSWFEVVLKRRLGDQRDPTKRSKYDDGKIGLRKLAIRAQDTLAQWEFDETGGVQAMKQKPPPDYAERTIPIEKALLFRTRVTKGNPEGRSILRNAHRSWFFAKNIQNIEAIGIERDLAGLPKLVPPEQVDIWNPNDVQAQAYRREAEQLVSSIRRDEQEGILLPYGWEFDLVTTGGQRQFDAGNVIERYEKRIATSVLADVILMGQDKVGSFALSKTKETLFTSALETYLDQIANVINMHLVPRLMRLNASAFPGVTGHPQLKHGEIDQISLEELGAFVKALSDSGAPIWPNEEMLIKILDKAGLPAPAEDELEAALEAKRPPQSDPAADPAGQELAPADEGGAEEELGGTS